ncbi:sporulation protein YqfC [Orenia metallireducens]|jgi:sporulation protein YqfC|uniref:Sporulation protein YqfC n=1 Tax=Orenia metallireducens TaxID=1413210 RepID=A0A285G5E9_9FIRM|nr:sporulation protein YqfC [Orenia metallireducens]PRX28343.1 sporulation protein YqfC [Orenia metallireducens]SNY18810.1 sporulation protein YqfC [Orenia metallireducens]
MGKKEKAKELFANIFDLPQEVVLDLPRISLVGGIQLAIENHRGIIKYTPEFIKIRFYRGQMVIEGKDMSIDSLEEEIIIIEGKITDLKIKSV